MSNAEFPDLSTWILIEAYRNGSGESQLRPEGGAGGSGGLGSYRVSRRAIYQCYFRMEEDPEPSAESAAPRAEAPRLARLKKAAMLARSVKQMLEQKLIAPPSFGGLTTGIRHVLAIHAEYFFLTETGVHEAESLLADISA